MPKLTPTVCGSTEQLWRFFASNKQQGSECKSGKQNASTNMAHFAYLSIQSKYDLGRDMLLPNFAVVWGKDMF